MAGEIILGNSRNSGSCWCAGDHPGCCGASVVSIRRVLHREHPKPEHARVSYGRALREFCNWCEERAFRLEDLNPVIAAGYIELPDRERGYSKPPVKQHLAAIRVLFGYLVAGGIIRMNPASSVRGPKSPLRCSDSSEMGFIAPSRPGTGTFRLGTTTKS